MAIFILRPPIASAGTAILRLEDSYPDFHSEAEVRKALAVLENRVGGQKFTAKAKDKLFVLSPRQTRLVISLSEVIAHGGQTTGADLAFLIMTVLIIFS
jgi:hypothetical protein